MTESRDVPKIVDVVERIHRIRRARWDLEAFRGSFARRSVAQILESGEVNYMNPCADLTTAAAVLLQEKGFEPTLVVDEAVSPHSGEPTLHFAIELPVGRRRTLHTVDLYGNETRIQRGDYGSARRVPSRQLALKRFPVRGHGRSSTLLDILGIENLDEMGRVFDSCRREHLRAAYEAMRRADSPQLYERVGKIKRTVRKVL